MLAGIFFVLAAIASIPALALYHSVLHDPRYIVGSGPDTQVLLGACCEIVAAISVIGTATVLFPIIRRQSEGMALSYVVGRLLEAALIVVGIMSLLSIVALRQHAAGAAEGHRGGTDRRTACVRVLGRGPVRPLRSDLRGR